MWPSQHWLRMLQTCHMEHLQLLLSRLGWCEALLHLIPMLASTGKVVLGSIGAGIVFWRWGGDVSGRGWAEQREDQAQQWVGWAGWAALHGTFWICVSNIEVPGSSWGVRINIFCYPAETSSTSWAAVDAVQPGCSSANKDWAAGELHFQETLLGQQYFKDHFFSLCWIVIRSFVVCHNMFTLWENRDFPRGC